MKRMILCFLLSLALAAVSFAQEPADSLQRVSREAPAEAQAPGEQTAEQLWNKANTAYINGDFRRYLRRVAFARGELHETLL